MTRTFMLFVGAMGLVVASRAIAPGALDTPVAAAAQTQKIPRFEWDPTWPKPVPNEQWAFGPMVGVGIDSKDNVWVIHRRTAILDNDRYTAAARRAGRYSWSYTPRIRCRSSAMPV